MYKGIYWYYLKHYSKHHDVKFGCGLEGHSHSSALPRGVGMAIEVLFSSSPSCQDQPRVYLMSLPSGKRLPMGKWENIGKPIGKWRFTLW